MPNDISRVTFKLCIRRRPLYYIMNVFIACCLLSFIAAVTFILPPSCAERLGLSKYNSLCIIMHLPSHQHFSAFAFETHGATHSSAFDFFFEHDASFIRPLSGTSSFVKWHSSVHELFCLQWRLHFCQWVSSISLSVPTSWIPSNYLGTEKNYTYLYSCCVYNQLQNKNDRCQCKQNNVR